MSIPSFPSISAQALAEMLRGHEPFALFDVRDEGVHARGHLLFACPLPLADLEVRLPRLVPRSDTLLVLASDAGDGLSERAAERCREAGYTRIALLADGNQAWEEAGFHLFSGIHVPSKAFGELVEAHYRTPMIDPAELHAMMAAGRKLRIFDSRPPHEFQRMSLPGARNCPGADLLACVPSEVPDEDTLVVINCAGRTRSIIGAQSLINAGMPGRVVALRNGTMGWHLAGFELEHGRQALVSPRAGADMSEARRMAAELRERFGIALVNPPAGHAAFQDALILDVRGPWEYEAGHLPGARNAPGGQLVQATDLYLAVRHASLVLVDDDQVRASVTASWLVQMGWRDVRVTAVNAEVVRTRFTERGRFQPLAPERIPQVPEIAPDVLQRELQAGRTALIDVSSSDAYYKGHVAGARFAIRSRFPRSLPALPRFDHLVLMAEDDTVARFAALEAAKIYGAPVHVLAGGLAAARAAGLPMAEGLDGAMDPPEDMWHIPSSPLGGLEPAMKQYISWEIALSERVAGEPGTDFRVGLPQAAGPEAGAAPALLED